MGYRHIFMFASVLACLLACNGGTKPDTNGTGRIYRMPPARANPEFQVALCRDKAHLLAWCEVAVETPDYTSHVDFEDDNPRFKAEVLKRENQYANQCISEAMTRQNADLLSACLDTIKTCADLPRCVGDVYKGDPQRSRQMVKYRLRRTE